MKTTDQLRDFFEENDFSVHLYEQDDVQCAEVESWTDGGVDMIINLNPFIEEEFESYVNDFDIDDEIESNRNDKLYCANFTISQGVKDFTKYHKNLKRVLKLLKHSK